MGKKLKRAMWERVDQCFFIIILMSISFPAGYCENNTDVQIIVKRSAKLRSKSLIPLRDDSDYIRENDRQNSNGNLNTNDEYDDEYSSYDDASEQSKRNESINEYGVRQQEEIVEQAQSRQAQIVYRPKELSDIEIEAILKSSVPSPDATAPLTIESCPKQCSCLNDFMDCNRLRLMHLPHVPQYIQTLDLSQNNFNVEVCEKNIKSLRSLIDLRLNQNKLTRLPLFHGLFSLQILELSDNEITEITATALAALPKLTHLNLSRNLIHFIAANSFPKDNLLQKINLNFNRIDKLNRRAFETLVRLTDLKVNNNRISQLPTGLFTRLKKLKKLSLNGNELSTSLQYASFSNLTSLTSLKLRNNFIVELITGVFHGLNNLNFLDLANNNLSEINKGGLLNLTSLNKLNLSNNSIQTIGKSCWEFTQKITHLDVSKNELSEITIGTLDMLAKLKSLDLHGNKISIVSSGAFNVTPNLETLDLSQNKISWTIEDSFAPFAALTKLDSFYLNNNQIKAINKNAFLGLTNLSRLDLRNNNITAIEENAFETHTTPALTDLQLNSTNLICDCNLLWFYFWLKNNNNDKNGNNNRSGRRAVDGPKNSLVDVRCAYPSTLRNKPLLHLKKDDFTCNDTPRPQMIDEPKSPVLAIKGKNQTIECVAFSSVGSSITFKWKRDNVPIDDNLIDTKMRNKDEARLRVKEKVMERRREVNRIPLRINVSAPKVPLASSSVSKLRYDDGDEDDYESDDDDTPIGTEDGEYESEQDRYNDENEDDVLATVEDIEANIPLNSTIATSRLYLNNIDHSHAGRYQCIASNSFGQAYSQKFKVTVASYPVFTKQPANVTVRPSETVRLDCAVDGDPKPQVYWQFNFGNDFPAAKERRMRVMPGDEAFIIENAKPHDSGIYTCTAENPAGLITTNVTVEILEQPTFIKPLQSKEVVIGESAVLECLDGGSSITEIKWFKNSLPILKSDRYLFTNGNQLLIIAKTQIRDAGMYTCETENSIGKERLAINLTIRLVESTGNSSTSEGVNKDEITAIVIITVVICATATSIIWAIIIYKSKQKEDCNPDDSNENGIENNSGKSNRNALSPVRISITPKGTEELSGKSVPKSIRTATISKCRGVLRSSSHSSLGVSDDIFCHYKDNNCSVKNNLLHQQLQNGTTDSEEDDPNNDHEALLGNYEQYSNSLAASNKCSDNDSFVMQIHNGTNSISSQHEGNTENATTAECVDEDIDEDQLSSIKTKTSLSLNSSSHSIPALPLNDHEFGYSSPIQASAPPLSTFFNKSANGPEANASSIASTLNEQLTDRSNRYKRTKQIKCEELRNKKN